MGSGDGSDVHEHRLTQLEKRLDAYEARLTAIESRGVELVRALVVHALRWLVIAAFGLIAAGIASRLDVVGM